jgi:hypothetical protein
MTCDWLDANPSGIGLCIDIMDPIEFWPQIPLHLRPRVRYHRSTTNEDLDETQVHKLLRQYCAMTSILLWSTSSISVQNAKHSLTRELKDQ